MAKYQWAFERKRPGDTTRDPITGEFFATEAIRNSAEALVREGIQNSLDARLPAQRVEVRLYVSGDSGAASAASVAPFFEGISQHLHAEGNGLRDGRRPRSAQSCKYLVFEDFGTEGLGGDPLQWHAVAGAPNGFFAFFRAEGENAKNDSDRRGRWGVGKFVFPRASEGSAFFGLSKRHSDGRSVLLGRAILKSHSIKGVYHVPDGYFGDPRTLPDGEIVGPIEDADTIRAFSEAFGLQRGSRSGLSIVVPWYDSEITIERLLEATMRDWFYSILADELAVSLSSPAASIRLTAQTFAEYFPQLSDDVRADLEPLVELTRYALSDSGRVPIRIGPADTSNSPQWSAGMLSDELLKTLRSRLDANTPIGVRIPIDIRPKDDERQSSHFDIYIAHDENADDGRPIFVREGIIVSDAKGARARGLRSIVVCNDKPLADLLGDAENPSHTEWRPDTANFKDKYVYGPGYLRFIKDSVGMLASRMQSEEDDSAPTLLLDLFAITRRSEGDRATRQTRAAGKQGAETPPPPLPPPRRPRGYRVSPTSGGFSISRGAPDVRPPEELNVTVAYDVRRGSPFKRYEPMDFQLLQGSVQLDGPAIGVEIVECSENRMRLRIVAPDFQVAVTGFDINRDVIVRVVPGAKSDDDATD